MISMRRTLLPGMLATIGLGSLWSSIVSAADPPLCNTPASYRLFNPSTMGPRTSGCGRCEPVPCPNPGFFLDNPRGTGMDDPWRPPQKWPQTRYPVVPAYTRPSYGFYETSWRVLPLCNRVPNVAGPLSPPDLAYHQPPMPPVAPIRSQQAPAANGANPPLPRPPVVPPAVQASPQGPPAATPPAAKPLGPNGQMAAGRRADGRASGAPAAAEAHGTDQRVAAAAPQGHAADQSARVARPESGGPAPRWSTALGHARAAGPRANGNPGPAVLATRAGSTLTPGARSSQLSALTLQVGSQPLTRSGQ